MNNIFHKARPVWLEGTADEMNVGAGFLAEFNCSSSMEQTFVHLTSTGRFRIFVNGQFVAHGPERAAHGYARMEEWSITEFLVEGPNHVAVEIIVPRVDTYYTLDEPGFLQAEVVCQGKVLCHTDVEGKGFSVFRLRHRVGNVQRYSFQRGFTEVYRMGPHSDAWRTGKHVPASEKLAEVPGTNLLPRRAPLPVFPIRDAIPLRRSRLTPCKPEKYWTDRCIENTDPLIKGFPNDAIDDIPAREWQEFSHSPCDQNTGPLATLESATYDLGTNFSGFVRLRVSCPEPSRLIAVFDELKTEDRIEFGRNMTVNVLCWNLEAGDYELESFEPYTMRFLQVGVMRGKADIKGIALRGYEAPIEAVVPVGCDRDLKILFEAAVNTLRQNAADLLMDCPSRERAGWLSDSFFSARAAFSLTGTTDFETAFLENYLLAPDPFPNLPPGMLPMCYPADHPDKNFIPQWPLWLVCELLEFRERGGDPSIITGFESKIRGLFKWFAGYENEFGLLERLPGWQFVEWSKANDLVNDVNFPTNWLYAAALDAAAALYGDASFSSHAAHVRNTAAGLSWNGDFFLDRAVRSEGKLNPVGDLTEACQYYAFYFSAATPASHPILWDLLLRKFDPRHPPEDAYSHIAPANMLYGYWMRLELLSRYNEQSQMLDEAKKLLLPMVQRTGTFWEKKDASDSCCHGFTSFIVCLLADEYKSLLLCLE